MRVISPQKQQLIERVKERGVYRKGAEFLTPQSLRILSALALGPKTTRQLSTDAGNFRARLSDLRQRGYRVVITGLKDRTNFVYKLAKRRPRAAKKIAG